MSTRSAIILKLDNGTYQGIYSHWDGYTSHNGRILFDHYKTYDKVKELVDLGSISVLAPEVKPSTASHTFKSPEEGVVVAYHRDRGESWDTVEPIYGKTIQSVESKIYHNGFVYVFENGKWTVNNQDLEKRLESPEVGD
jgi:hypothetical protein